MSIMSYNGGAIIAMKGKDCVAIASDMRYGIQAQTISFDFKKIFEMNDKLYLGLTGLATDVQTVFGPYFIEPVIAGLDPKTNEPFVASCDLIGCPMIPEDFVVTGTCADQLYGMCESLWEPDLAPEDLFETISQALLNAVDRDAMSGFLLFAKLRCLTYGDCTIDVRRLNFSRMENHLRAGFLTDAQIIVNSFQKSTSKMPLLLASAVEILVRN
eukprot:gene1090-431_t